MMPETNKKSKAYEQERVARDVVGTRLGTVVWLAGCLITLYLIMSLDTGIHGNTWIEHQGLQYENSNSFFYSLLINFLASGIWLCGSALPFMLILLLIYGGRRAWQYWHHSYDSASLDNFLQTASGFVILLLFLSGLAATHSLPFSSWVNYKLAGGIIGSEVSSLLIYFSNHTITFLITFVFIIVGFSLFFRISFFKLIEYIGTVIDVTWEFYVRKKAEYADRSLGDLARKMREETVTIHKQNQQNKTVRIVRQKSQRDLFSQPITNLNVNSTTTKKSNINNSITQAGKTGKVGRVNSRTTFLQPKRNPNSSIFSKIANKSHKVKIVVPEKPAPVINKTLVRIIAPAEKTPAPIIEDADLQQSSLDRIPLDFGDVEEKDFAKTILLSPDDDIAKKLVEDDNLVITKEVESEDLEKVKELKEVASVDELFQGRQFEKTRFINSEELQLALSSAQNASPQVTLNKSAAEFAKKEILDNAINNKNKKASALNNKPPASVNNDILDEYLPDINKTSPNNVPLKEEKKDISLRENSKASPIEISKEVVNEVAPARKKVSPSINYEQWDDFTLPPLELLDNTPSDIEPPNNEVIQLTSQQIESALKSFGVSVQVAEAYPGPVVTSYHIELAQGVKGAQIVNLAKDLARSLAVNSIRVVESIADKPYMGLEVPNKNRQMVKLAEILSSQEYHDVLSVLTLAIGKDISGVPVTLNLGKMPHLLVAGTTGSGKSVGVNDMILSMLFKATPNEVRLVMIDPKMVELSVYDDIPHLLSPVITDMKQAAGALNWCVQEMERRQELLASIKVRNLADFNKNIIKARKTTEPLRDKVAESIATNNGELNPEYFLTTMPYLVVIVDEYADLFMVIGKKVEELIARLAQKGRACGIHIILATQRPSADVVTGLIKANIPSRIAFQVSSKLDSRVITDQAGAEALLGNGDMLYSNVGRIQRMHGAFVSDDEVNAIAEHLRSESEPKYLFEAFEDPSENNENSKSNNKDNNNEYDLAVQTVIDSRNASISFLQRRMSIGFNKAAKLIERMEEKGLVSSAGKNGKREVLSGSR